jgi:hypothetical protein
MAHATITLEYQGEPVEIDAGIAELIESLWAQGVETSGSCEDGGTSGEESTPVGIAWVTFPQLRDVLRFEAACVRCCGQARIASVQANAEQIALAEEQGMRWAGYVLFPTADIAALTAEVARGLAP